MQRRFYLFLIIVVLLSVCIACQGDRGGGTTPAQPGMTAGTVVTRLNIDCPDYAIYPDGVTPVLGYTVYVSPVPGYSTVNMTQADVGLSKIVLFSSIIPGDGVWYVSAAEYDARGSSGRSQNELKIEAQGGKFYTGAPVSRLGVIK